MPAKPAPSNHAQTFDSMVQEYLASQAAVDATSHVPSAIPAPAATAPSASPAAQPVVASTSNDGVAAMDEYVYDVYHIVSPSAQSAADLPANSAAVADFSDVVHDVFAHDGDGDDWLVHEDEDAEDSEVDSEDSNRQDQDAFEYPDDDDVEQHDVDDDGDDEDEQFARAHGRRAQAFDSDQEGHDDDGDGDDDDEDDQRDLQHRMAMQLN